MDDLYKYRIPEELPWNRVEPPKELVELVGTKIISPCSTLEIGCGLGNYALYLAKCGFEVDGMDISGLAISKARESARKQKINCNFFQADFLKDCDSINQNYDFIFDWLVLHHIYPKQRIRYVQNVDRLLNLGGKYLSVCFSEKSKAFGAKGKYRATPIGTKLYFSSEQEIENLYSPFFRILDLKTIQIEGKTEEHFVNYMLAEKR